VTATDADATACEDDRVRRLAIASVLLAAACSEATTDQSWIGRTVVTFPGNDGTLRVEVADSTDERRLGLMGRTEIPPNGGMVFLFDEPVAHDFVMRNTLIPLSIAFWDADGRIVQIMEMVPCRVEPCGTYRPSRKYVAAVEARAGWFADHGIGVGDRAEVGPP
jgi:uncharacterized membrane protein (UPF0127 family)